MTIEKTNRINILFDIYGDLLNAKQREILRLYYLEDFSLSEISESFGATKQAASDLLKRSEKKLESFEAVLNLAEKERRRAEILSNLTQKYPEDEDLRSLRGIDE